MRMQLGSVGPEGAREQLNPDIASPESSSSGQFFELRAEIREPMETPS
jgi:hypothetical protein